MDLKKKDSEDMLKQAAASEDAAIEEVVKRVKAEAQEQLAVEMSQMDDHIRQF